MQRMSNTDVSWLYKSSKLTLNPEYVWTAVNSDSAELLVKIPVKGILYKLNASGEMAAQLNLRLIFFQSYESKKIIDSLSFLFSPPYTDDSTAYVLKSFFVKRPSIPCLLALRLNDLQRGFFNEHFISIDPSLQSEQNFKFMAFPSDLPLFTTVVNDESQIIISNVEQDDKLWVRYFNRNFPIALPPFSNRQPLTFSYIADSTFRIYKQADGHYALSLHSKGLYHLQNDTLIKQGATLLRMDAQYPLVTDAEQLIEAIRYLTTREEYDKLILSSDHKKAIDDFWIELSGSRERARFLIRTFYTRMQNANKFFTSYLEGWKTDRGMIYLIYGPPNLVYKTSQMEYWDYGMYRGFGNLNFSFKKITNPFSMNDFTLVRSATYEPVWYMAVDNWRQGRITGEE